MTARVETLTGPALAPVLPALSALRLSVFREWPYLYDGTDASEREHLKEFAACPDAAIVVAWEDSRPVGAATCQTLTGASDNIKAPFLAAGLKPEAFCYFGESVLLLPWRGQGIGVEFFRQREAHARRLGKVEFAAFCAVQRPANHPQKPAYYVPLDGFWRRRGYARRSDLVCRMSWRDLGAAGETEKPLAFWLKSLTGKTLP